MAVICQVLIIHTHCINCYPMQPCPRVSSLSLHFFLCLFKRFVASISRELCKYVLTTLLEKKVLSRTLKGSLAVPIGEPFEEPFLVAGRTHLGSIQNNLQWVLPGTLQKYPMGTSEEESES